MPAGRSSLWQTSADKLKKSEIEPNLERIRDVLGLDDDFPLLLYSCTAKVGRRELLGFIENNI